jgi:hypothetical protein
MEYGIDYPFTAFFIRKAAHWPYSSTDFPKRSLYGIGGSYLTAVLFGESKKC